MRQRQEILKELVVGALREKPRSHEELCRLLPSPDSHTLVYHPLLASVLKEMKAKKEITSKWRGAKVLYELLREPSLAPEEKPKKSSVYEPDEGA